MLGGFAQYTLQPTEFVGRIDRPLREFHTDLRSLGFTREPIAALKHHPDGRKSAGSWVRRNSRFADRQLHVTLFWNEDETVDVCAHWEYSWIRHPYKHYWAADYDIGRGVDKMRALLTEHEIPFRIEPTDS